MPGMRRREFVSLLGGAAAWPVVASAQQPDRVRRIGILLPATADDAQFQAYVGAFLQAMGERGWNIGRNISFKIIWATASGASIRKHAGELVALAPDVVVAVIFAAPLTDRPTETPLPTFVVFASFV